MSYILEVCADSVESAIAAQEGGSDRIELCSGLVIGGLSPSAAMFRQAKEHTDIPIRVLLRPRSGDFCYSEYEFRILKEEVEQFRELGADGAVLGILRPDGSLNTEQMKELTDAAGGMGVTLHRAFDVCADPRKTLEDSVSLGVDTILTSGQKQSAWEGRELLAELVHQAKGRVHILAGAGIGPEVIDEIAVCTGVSAFHMSGKKIQDSRMRFRREGVPMGIPGFDEFGIWQTDKEQIRRAAEVLRKRYGNES